MLLRLLEAELVLNKLASRSHAKRPAVLVASRHTSP